MKNKKDFKEMFEYFKPILYLVAISLAMWLLSLVIN